MVGRSATWLGLGLLLAGFALAVAWTTSPDPRGNLASMEREALIPRLAPLEEAVTLAQVRRSGGRVATVHGEILIRSWYQKVSYCCFRQSTLPSGRMKDLIFLLIDLLITLAKLLRPGGGRAIIAENLLL